MLERSQSPIAHGEPVLPASSRRLVVEVGEGRFFGTQRPIWLEVEFSQQQYRYGDGVQPIIPLRNPTGERTHISATAYVTNQHSADDRGANPAKRAGGEGPAIGFAQAWHYEHDGTLVLWECLLDHEWRAAGCCPCERRCHDATPDDPNLHQLWRGFERLLMRCFPTANRILTPSWEPTYDHPAWRSFLASRGYHPQSERIYAKDIEHAGRVRRPGRR